MFFLLLFLRLNKQIKESFKNKRANKNPYDNGGILKNFSNVLCSSIPPSLLNLRETIPSKLAFANSTTISHSNNNSTFVNNNNNNQTTRNENNKQQQTNNSSSFKASNGGGVSSHNESNQNNYSMNAISMQVERERTKNDQQQQQRQSNNNKTPTEIDMASLANQFYTETV